jgi:hypothetical protein
MFDVKVALTMAQRVALWLHKREVKSGGEASKMRRGGQQGDPQPILEWEMSDDDKRTGLREHLRDYGLNHIQYSGLRAQDS